jgi:hypothetical protein
MLRNRLIIEAFMIDEEQRSETEAEISALMKKQTKATEDATFLGWNPAEAVAHEERHERLVWLRRQLAR